MADSDILIPDIREAVRALCAGFPSSYWRELEPEGYPTEFVQALTDAGWLAALIPEEYGGSGLGISQARVILEEINASGGNAGVCHAQMYTMASILREGTAVQKEGYLPGIAAGELRLQAFGVTEPTVGSDTTQITTRATRTADGYEISGQKIWTSRAQHSDLMLLLARTADYDPTRRSKGLSVFLVDLREAGSSVEIRPIKTMINHHTTEVFIDRLQVPVDALIGQEGDGFKLILQSMNAERILIASECVGDGRWFIERSCSYAGEREVFGRPIGQNQGVQLPIADAYAAVHAADLVTAHAAQLFDADEPCGDQAAMAKYLASNASWKAANVAMDVHGGFAYAVEYDIERKFRETRLYQTAPISNNLVLTHLAHNTLGLPRSY